MKIKMIFPLLIAFLSISAQANTFRYLQAENAAQASTCGSDFQDSNHSAFSGVGFANCSNNTSSFIQWNYNSPRSGNHRLSLRFANGSGSPRPAEILINGSARTLAMNATSTWSTWAIVTLDAYLQEGNNTIRLRGLSGSGLANIDRLDIDDLSLETDWGVAMAESTMLRFPKPEDFSWEYSGTLAVHGVYLVYERTRDKRYLNYIKRWVDARISSNGDLMSVTGRLIVINNLDVMFATNLILNYWQGLDDPNKYSASHRLRKAMQTMRNRYSENNNTAGTANNWNTLYPRTSDGGYWHSLNATGQLWLDGVFMSEKFLTRFGNQFGDDVYTNNEATQQLLVTHRHLKDWNSGLLWHAYDEQGNSWTTPGTLHSQEFWCRAIGWFSVMSIDTLHTLPKHHANYDNMRSLIQNLIPALTDFQDPNSGRWFQVMNRQSDSRNWTETSCSSMFAYTIKKAIKLGHVSSSYNYNAERAFNGVLQKVRYEYNSTLGATLLNIYDVTQGTSIGNLSYYLNRQRPLNDRHGHGPFMMMAEEFRALSGNDTLDIGEAGAGFCKLDGQIESDHSGWGGIGYANTYNAVGNGIEYRFTLPENGDIKLRWRYSNGGKNRAARILIDGQSNLNNVDFPSTQSWSNWQHVETQTYVEAGTHTLRLEATNAAGLANIDVLRITANSPSEINCR